MIVEVEESVAAFAQAGANTDLWSYDLEQQRMARFTFDPAEDRTPVWTPDGARVVFSSTRDGDVLNLFVKAADGSGRAERLTTDARLQAPLSVSADGRTLLFTHSGSLWTLPIDGQGQPEILLEGSSDATLSPDGRWLAYVSASDEPQVFVRPFPNIDDRLWPVSNGLGQSPTWGRNGRELFYQTRTSPDEPVSVMAVAYDTEPSFRPSVPIELFQGSYRFGGRSFDVREDSQAFLMVKEDPGSAQAEIIVAQDWFEELKRLVPTN